MYNNWLQDTVEIMYRKYSILLHKNSLSVSKLNKQDINRHDNISCPRITSVSLKEIFQITLLECIHIKPFQCSILILQMDIARYFQCYAFPHTHTFPVNRLEL